MGCGVALLGGVLGKAQCPCVPFGVNQTLIRACSISPEGTLNPHGAQWKDQKFDLNS